GIAPASSLLRTNKSRAGPAFSPGNTGFQFEYGATDSSIFNLRGPTRRSYSAAIVTRQLSTASARSSVFSVTCTSFSASPNVVVETSGPTAGPVPYAGGAPAGASVGCCCAPSTTAPDN